MGKADKVNEGGWDRGQAPTGSVPLPPARQTIPRLISYSLNDQGDYSPKHHNIVCSNFIHSLIQYTVSEGRLCAGYILGWRPEVNIRCSM